MVKFVAYLIVGAVLLLVLVGGPILWSVTCEGPDAVTGLMRLWLCR
jgi:hypothetical protein